MTARKTQGIYALENKTFYYLETGDIITRSSLDRVKSKLIQKDLISYHRTSSHSTEPDHKTMTYGEAEDQGIAIQPIFLSDHIKKLFLNKQSVASQGDPWASSTDG
jgi:hypothetical protein